MITSLEVVNFKRLSGESFILRPLTVLTGLNGTGKSTAIQSLLLARQAVGLRGASAVQLNGPYGLSLGEAEEVRHRGMASAQIEIRLTDDEHAGAQSFRFDVPDDRSLHLDISHVPDNPPTGLTRQGCGFSYLCAERLGPRDQLGVSAEHPDHVGVGVQGEYTAQVLALHESRKVRGAIRHPDTEHTHRVSTLRTQVESWVSDIVRPIRIAAQWPAGITASTIRFQEIDAYGLSEPIRPANMGFGFSYTLPVIVAGLLTRPSDLLIVENPEAHLHPGGQSRMGRFLARVAGSGVQVLVETHSDHVLNGIRLAVAEEGTLAADSAVLHYFSDDGGSPIPVEMTSRGELSTWPEGFFDQIERDLGRLARARRRER